MNHFNWVFMIGLSVFPVSLSEPDTISRQAREVATGVPACPTGRDHSEHQDLLPFAHPTTVQLSKTNPFPTLPHPCPELNRLETLVLILKDILDKCLCCLGGSRSHPCHLGGMVCPSPAGVIWCHYPLPRHGQLQTVPLSLAFLQPVL